MIQEGDTGRYLRELLSVEEMLYTAMSVELLPGTAVRYTRGYRGRMYFGVITEHACFGESVHIENCKTGARYWVSIRDIDRVLSDRSVVHVKQ